MLPQDVQLLKAVEAAGLPSARRHLFLCADQSKPKCCSHGDSLLAWDYLKRRLDELGLSGRGGVLRTKANCLRVCVDGPIAVVYPDGVWYQHCSPENLERIIVNHLLHGRIVDELVLYRRHTWELPRSQPGVADTKGFG